MRRKISSGVFVILLFVCAPLVYAQMDSSSVDGFNTTDESVVYTTDDTVVVTNTAVADEAQTETADNESGAQDDASYWREVRKQKFEELNAKHTEIKQKVEAKVQEVQANIQATLEENKVEVIEKIQSQLAKINDRHMKHFLLVLDRLSKITEKIQSRADTLFEEHGYDETVQSNIDAAYNAISSAQLAVEAQQENTYAIVVSGEDSARAEVKAVRDTLFTDLRDTRTTISFARTELQNAFQALKNLHNQFEGAIGE